MPRIAIIGGGNIGEALLSGLLRAGHQVKNLVVAEASEERGAYLSKTYSVLVTSVGEAVENAAFVVVAVKPFDVGAVLAEVAAADDGSDDAPERVFVSVAAGVETAYVESKLSAGVPVVRVMPNAPALVGAGTSVLAKGRFATPDQLGQVAALFDAVGDVLTVAEAQLDAVTAVSGSGPAYFLLLVEALVDAAVATGINRRDATELAVQTMAGSAAMLLERIDGGGRANRDTGPDTSPAQLRAAITSPGGTTAAALRELERGGLRTAVDAAVRAGKTRSEQLRITPE